MNEHLLILSSWFALGYFIRSGHLGVRILLLSPLVPTTSRKTSMGRRSGPMDRRRVFPCPPQRIKRRFFVFFSQTRQTRSSFPSRIPRPPKTEAWCLSFSHKVGRLGWEGQSRSAQWHFFPPSPTMHQVFLLFLIFSTRSKPFPI